MSAHTTSPSWTTVARWEGHRLVRERTFWFLLALYTVLMLLAGLNGRAEQAHQQATAEALAAQQADAFAARREAALAEEASGSAAASPWGPRSAWGMGRAQGVRLAIPPAPLVGLAVGQSDLAPAVYHVHTGAAAAQAPDVRPANPFRLLVGGLDAAFVVLYLLPLFLIVLLFDLTSADREQGTLRLLLAGPLRLRTLALVRAVVRGGAVLAATVLLLALVFAVTGGSVWRFALFVLAALVYGAFWMALALLANAARWPSATAAAVLAGAWLVLVVLVPALVHTVAGVWYPPPARATYVAAQREANAEGLRESRQALARFLDHHPDLAPGPEAGEPTYVMSATARDAAVTEALAPIEATDQARRARRNALIGALSVLSPALLAHDALLETAGTGAGRRAWVEDQVAAFRAAWADHFLPRYFGDNLFRVADYDAIPTFTFAEEPAGRIGQRVAVPLGLLLLFALVLTAWAARRYDRRPMVD